MLLAGVEVKAGETLTVEPALDTDYIHLSQARKGRI